MGRVFRTGGVPGFVVDPNSTTRSPGVQIDWDQIENAFRSTANTVTAGSGGAAAGATSLPVAALTAPIADGVVLDFGQVAVTATVGVAGAAQGATSIPVAALSGPIPTGTDLDFGGAKFARTTANAAAGATSLTVAALPTALVSGDVATYTDSKFAEVTTPAAVGDTSIGVEPLASQIYAGDTAVLGGSDTLFGYVGHKYLHGGAILARTSSGLYIPRSIASHGETASGLLIDPAEQFALEQALTGFGMFTGGSFYQDLLPEKAASGFSGWLTELASVKPGFRFERYADSRTSEGFAIAGR